jgi:dTDP-3-amino-3,4,6-trideoxy-alpha-D-glucopyranose N,N-dimethyltransferase
MYTRSAKFYDALYHFKDYADASRQLHQLIQQHNPDARTLLDVGCGTGRHVECLREYYRVEGLDLNPNLLQIARDRCPEVTFHCANMMDFKLSQKFDIVTCLFSSIAYVKTVENLSKAMSNLAFHLEPRGMLIIEPFFWPENYWTGTITANFVNQPKLKIAWMYTSGPPKNGIAALDIHYLVGTPDGVDQFNELHEFGLFTDQEYRSAFRKLGLDVYYDHEGLFKRGLYWGIRASQSLNTSNLVRDA